MGNAKRENADQRISGCSETLLVGMVIIYCPNLCNLAAMKIPTLSYHLWWFQALKT